MKARKMLVNCLFYLLTDALEHIYHNNLPSLISKNKNLLFYPNKSMHTGADIIQISHFFDHKLDSAQAQWKDHAFYSRSI